MERIASFNVDHTKLNEGIYISRIDGDVTTYDLRMRKPNTDDLISVSAMHSMEHMFATVVRNSEMSDKVIYFGPMGCQTGFYLLMRTHDHGAVVNLIKKVIGDIIEYTGEMPGNSAIECGNYRSLNMEAAKNEARMYIEKIRHWTDKMLDYEA